MSTLTIRHHSRTLEIPVASIVRIQSLSNYCRIYWEGGHPVTVAKVLQWFEAQLPDEMFVRVHRSHLVNRKFVQEIGVAGDQLILSTGDKISISRRRRNSLAA